MITIVDYGLGNIQALANVYKKLNKPFMIAKRAEDLELASKIILPGVGAFDHAMNRLQASGMGKRLNDLVLNQKTLVLGICVGMQMLANASDEGNLPGLGWIPGYVRGFKTNPKWGNLPTPHMGWNDVYPQRFHTLFKGLETGSRFYFLHSFFFEPVELSNVEGIASYGIEFCCAVHSKNIYGVQFHPEKSHHFGIQLLKNFADL